MRKAAYGREQESHREVRHFVVEDVGSVGDDHAAPSGRVYLDGIVADAEVRDDLERRHVREKGSVDAIPPARRDRADGRAAILEKAGQVVGRDALHVEIRFELALDLGHLAEAQDADATL